MDNNQFTGKISNVLAACNLGWLDLSNNHLSGEIPSWFRNFTDLQTLLLQNNLFKGQVPSILASDFFDASQNSLSGSLPSFTEEISSLRSLHLQGNRFTGSIPKSYVNLSRLLTLDLSDDNLSGRIPNFIDALSDLRILLLGENIFSGSIPNQLCQMRNISLLDLSRNSLSGSIPDCLPNISGPTSLSFMPESSDGVVPTYYRYQSILEKNYDYGSLNFLFEQDEANFVTKNRSGSYKGGILDYMSGLNLSCNNLTGQIPSELGMLVQVHALNLSHNQLTGHIPKLFSHLKQVESLDLSFNRLSGEIPSELIDLNFLEVFIVAHNNLSGRVPEMKGQFGTFPKSNFEGNLFLCGPQLEKNCTTLVPSTLRNASSSDESKDKWYDIDLLFFSASFVGTYFVFLLAVVTLLYMNPHWQRWWFNLAEECMYSCYYFLCDSLRSLSAHL